MIEYKWLPSEPSKEMKKHVSKYHSIVDYKQMWKDAPEVDQEPVVYLVWYDGKFTYTKHPEEIVDAYEILPLYTHPPKREQPLSIDTVMSIVGAIDWDDLPTEEDEWAYFAREIEKAHGIGGEE